MQTTRSNPDTIACPVGAYSYAVRVHRADAALIYVSGHIANDPEGTLVAPNELPTQTEHVFENLRAILEANGATSADVVKIQTYFTTLDGLAESRKVRLRYLPAEPPASTAMRVVALVVPEAVIEVDVVAVVPS
jgi:enamine deaminase RidA (YjgF/YER057c/UK114 family)